MTIKASSLLSIVAIWAAMIPAVVIEPKSWWSLIFAFLATGAVGTGAGRRLGLSRLIAITGIWLGTALAVGTRQDYAWVSIMAFLSTGAVVYSVMRRDALGVGAGIAFTWLMVGTVLLVNDDSAGSWISVFAFLTAGAVANTRSLHRRGLAAIVWWALAGGVMLAAAGWYWLCVPAFLLSAASLGFSDFSFPRRFEWDLFEREDDEGFVR
jgi:hypothetical protein